MRNFCCCSFKIDKRFLLAFIIALICSIICGIVLYKVVIYNVYFRDFAEEYIFNVFNFQNYPLLFTRFISDLIYFYIIFFICYFSKFKYLSLILIFLRGLFFGVYMILLVGANSFGGIIVAFFVFLPATLVVFGICYALADFIKCINPKYVLSVPAALAVIDLVFYALLINALFRLIIAIV